jgi:hypothetical protein
MSRGRESTMSRLKQRIVSFLREEDGLVLAEALIMLPLLIWVLVAMFIYWDVFRTINITQKAAYSVADLLSRQKTEVPSAYADGLQNVVDFLTPGGHPVDVRITSFEYDGINDEYNLLCSYSPDNKVAVLDEADIQPWLNTKIPALSHGENVFVVETAVKFTAQLDTAIAGFMVGVQDAEYGQFIVTRPRHRPLCIDTPGCACN